MIRFSGLAVGIVVLAGAVGAAQAPAGGGQPPPPPPMTNLQILPKDTPRPQVIATMQAFTQSLGVACNYCHVQEGRGGRNDFASDEKATEKGGARHDDPRARRQRQAARGGRQGGGRHDARRLRDLPSRRPDSEADHRTS